MKHKKKKKNYSIIYWNLGLIVMVIINYFVINYFKSTDSSSYSTTEDWSQSIPNALDSLIFIPLLLIADFSFVLLYLRHLFLDDKDKLEEY